jgi:hypothetical protein
MVKNIVDLNVYNQLLVNNKCFFKTADDLNNAKKDLLEQTTNDDEKQQIIKGLTIRQSY